MQESVTPTIPQSSQWSITWNRVANQRRWMFLLIGIGSFSSVIYPHPPLVAFGAIAGSTLSPKRAFLIALSIWFMNQLYGYGLRSYPQTAESFLWGLVMGLGMLLVTALAALRPPFSRTTWKGHGSWMAIAVLTGFLLFESLVLSLGFLLTGSHVLTWAILGHLLFKELIWAFALTLGYGFLARRTVRTGDITL
ncbi:hypothetical protein HC928_01890 [bacterium]|nr:hypothetical protein [bacterium]